MNTKTKILHSAASKDPSTGALSTPIYHASTYHQADVDASPEWEYGRSGNPTRKVLEDLLASLEGGTEGFAFASGMAAVTAALTAFVKAGDHIIAAQDIYGGSYRLLTKFLSKFGVEHTFIDTTDSSNIKKALRPNSKVLLLESPSNPLLKVTDIKACASIAKENNLLSIIDNTFMTPYLQKVFDLGVDISVHSATKFLGGHSDLIAGAVMVRTKEHGDAIRFVQNACGAILSPGDSWTLIRGIKTLAARMDVQCKSALTLAQWLQEQAWVSEVNFPGLESHPGYAISKIQASGFGAVLSIRTNSIEIAKKIMSRVKIWSVAVSLGGVESILSYPAKMSHASIPREERYALGITDELIRLSVGLEDVEDLIEDLKTAVQ